MALPSATPTERVVVAQPPTEQAVTEVAVVPSNTPLPTHTPRPTQTPVTPTDVPPTATVTAAPTEVEATNTPTLVPTLPLLMPSVPTLPPLGPSLPIPVAPDDTAGVPSSPIMGHVIINFAPESSEAERAAYLAEVDGTVVQEIASLDAVVVQMSDASADAELPESSAVTASEPDYYVTALDTPAPNDPLFGQQWALAAMNASAAWEGLPAETANVAVAVIDSGICADHPDLADRVLPGYDFVEDDALPQDVYGHGCAIAGIIAANVNDGVGMAGLAQNAMIMPLRVLDADGVGTYSDVAAAIVYAADQGAQVINLSLGGFNRSTVLEDAIDYAIDKGVVVIAAAGNAGIEAVLYPAAYAPVVAVGAVDQNLERAAYSSYGEAVDLYAPGSEITVPGLDDGWTTQSGTSFAAAYASAVAALRIAQDANLVLDGGVVSALPDGGLSVVEAPQPTVPPPALADAPLPAEYEPILQRIEETGSARVIVGLAGNFHLESELTPQGAEQQRVTIQSAQTSLVTALQAYDVQAVTRFQTIPYLSVVVDEAALRYLANSSQVSGIQLERFYRPDLMDSTGIIGANTAWASGYTGAGYTVAIVDTGVQSTHPFLSGKVVNGACFSYSGSDIYGTYSSVCPNGQMSQYGVAAGEACSVTGCDHGTHVAGIAAGDGTSFDGVARGASLFSVQVYTQVSSLYICGSVSPCIVAFDTEILLGLEWIYNQRGSYQIASANMSLGSSDHISTDCSSMNPSMASMVAQMKAANIATIAASGNYGGNTGVSFPACIGDIVNVAATDKSDNVASFSQLGANLDLGAPGVSIYSSVPVSTYAYESGTSMAAPHVAGAWAVMRQSAPTASFQQIYNAFVNTSVLRTRASDGGTVRRINLAAAYSSLQPQKPTGLYVTGSLTTAPVRPTYHWTHDNVATWYLLQVNGPSGIVHAQWYAASTLGCSSGTCSVQPSVTLSNGWYAWSVTGHKDGITGTASDASWFQVNVPVATPTKPTGLNVTGSLTTAPVKPTYHWTHDNIATWYLLQINGPSGTIHAQWYAASTLGCSGGTCSIQPDVTLSNGWYAWTVTGHRDGVSGPASDASWFQVNVVTTPTKPTGLNVTGSLTTAPVKPTYHWTHDNIATWYLLQINGPSGTIHAQWYAASSLGCSGGTCSIQPDVTLSNGWYAWTVTGHKDGVTGPASDASWFQVSVTSSTPTKPTGLNVTGSLTTAPVKPTYHWTHDNIATWYLLVINGPSGTIHGQWYAASTLGCSSGTCSLQPDLTLSNGWYAWTVTGHKDGVSGSTSDASWFQVAVP